MEKNITSISGPFNSKVIATRVEAIVIRLEAFAARVEAIALGVETIALGVEANYVALSKRFRDCFGSLHPSSSFCRACGQHKPPGRDDAWIAAAGGQ